MNQYDRIFNILAEGGEAMMARRRERREARKKSAGLRTDAPGRGSGYSTVVGRRGGMIRKLKSGEKSSPGLAGTGRTAEGEGGAGTVGDRDRLKKKLIFVKGQKIFKTAHPDLHKAATGLKALSIKGKRGV